MIKKSIFSLSLIIAAGLVFTPALTNADPCVAQGKVAAGSLLIDDSYSSPSQSQDQMSNDNSDQQSSDQSTDQSSGQSSNQDNSGMSTTDSGSMGSTGSDGSSDDSNSSE